MRIISDIQDQYVIGKWVFLGGYFNKSIAEKYLEMSLHEFKEKFPSIELGEKEWIERPSFSLGLKCQILNVDQVPFIKEINLASGTLV